MKSSFFSKALRVLLLTNGLVLIAGAMMAPIYALFVEKVGGGLLSASLTGGVFALSAAITTLIAGRFADRSKRDDVIVVVGYAFIGIGFLLYNVVDSIWALFAVQALVGFAEAFYSPSFDALYSKHLSIHKEGRQWGAWESINYLSIAIGAVFGGLIANAFGFHAIFVVMAILCFVSAIYIWRLPKHTL